MSAENPHKIDVSKKSLSNTLNSFGIDIPDNPDESVETPHEWLVRGTSIPETFGNSTLLPPNPGEWSSWGVFFADCISSVASVKPPSGLYYVMNLPASKTEYIIDPSKEFNELVRKEAEKLNLNPTTITGGVISGQEVYKQYNVFQYKRGIFTFYYPLPIQSMSYIFMYPETLERYQDLLSPDLKGKLQPILV